jgi:hypothetical protein
MSELRQKQTAKEVGSGQWSGQRIVDVIDHGWWPWLRLPRTAGRTVTILGSGVGIGIGIENDGGKADPATDPECHFPRIA